jgi:hypothetical protein
MISAFIFLPFTVHAEGDSLKIDDTASKSGVVKISYKSGNNNKLKVFVVKGSSKYSYDLKNDGTVEAYPLQLGDGEYEISVLENISGNKYRYVKTQKITVKLLNPDIVYQNSVQNINWDSNSKAIKKDLELIGKEKSFDKKLSIIYNFVIKQFTYDYEKLKTLKSGYLPDIDKTLAEKKGICYDYSSLFAAMKRSEGVPVKLVKGYTVNAEGYHAWNEIKINGKWVIVDTTYDSSVWKSKVKYTMAKNPKDYRKVYEY